MSNILYKERIQLNAKSYGFTDAVLTNTTDRQTNLANLQAAIDAAASEGRDLYISPGTYQIYGAPVINTDGFRLFGSMRSRLVQYNPIQPGMHVGAPLGTASATLHGVVIDGLWLSHFGIASAGGNALELGSGVWMSNFKNIICGNPFGGGSDNSYVSRRGVYVDETAGTTACFSNVYENFKITNFSEFGWHQTRAAFDGSTNSKYLNIYLSSGGGGDNRDISASGIPAYFGSVASSEFSSFNVEWSTASACVAFQSCRNCKISGFNLEGNVLKADSLQNMALVNVLNSALTFDSGYVTNNTFDSANNLQNPAYFRTYQGSKLNVRNLYELGQVKSGISNLAVVRNWDYPAGTDDQFYNLSGLDLGDGAGVDLVTDFIATTGTTVTSGELTDFQNSSMLTMADAADTIYRYRTPGVRFIPATATRNITLSRALSATNACRIPGGTTAVLYNSGSGAGLLQPKNYDGTNLGGTIALASGKRFVFDGTNWQLSA